MCLLRENIRERGRDMLVMITRVVDFQDREFSGRKQTRTIRNCANVLQRIQRVSCLSFILMHCCGRLNTILFNSVVMTLQFCFAKHCHPRDMRPDHRGLVDLFLILNFRFFPPPLMGFIQYQYVNNKHYLPFL